MTDQDKHSEGLTGAEEGGMSPVSPLASPEENPHHSTEYEAELDSEPLTVMTDSNTGDGPGEEEQPKSAFSLSSSDGDEDADDEAEEEGEEDDGDYKYEEPQAENQAQYQEVEEYQNLPYDARREYASKHPMPVVVAYRDDERIYKPRIGGHAIAFHAEREKQGEEFEKKKEEYRLGRPSTPPRSSPLRTSSTPDLLSPEDSPTAAIGILPEPSPMLVAPSEHDSTEDNQPTPRPASPNGRRFSAASFDWSEEDEDDESWIAGAIEEVRGPRSGPESSAVAASPPMDDVQQASQNETVVEDTESEAEFHDADEEISSLEIERPSSPNRGASSNARIRSQERSFGFKLTPEALEDSLGNEASEPSGENTSAEAEKAPANFAPVFDGAENDVPTAARGDPTSPNPDGPELYTGLRPAEGLEEWWKWHMRNQPRAFRTNRNIYNEDHAGDLAGEKNDDTSAAAEYLRRNRWSLKEKAIVVYGGTVAQRAFNIKSNMEDTLEYLRLQMLRYRAQRNDYFEKAKATHARVGARDRTIAELESNLREVERSRREVREQYTRLQPVLREWEIEKDLHEKERGRRKQLQGQLQNLTMFSEQYKKAAEENAELARIEKARRAARLEMSSIATVISEEPTTTQVVNKPASAEEANPPLLYPKNPLRSPPPAPQHLIQWPLKERVQLVPYMVDWINDHREDGSKKEPLSPAQLDEILGIGRLSWKKLIKGLGELGYFFRSDRLATALSNPTAIQSGAIPRPNLAVMYAARRLATETAVPELLREVVKLHDELDNNKMPQELINNIAQLEMENRQLQASQPRELTTRNEALLEHVHGQNAELEDLRTELKKIRKMRADQHAAEQEKKLPPSKTQVQSIVEQFVASTKLNPSQPDLATQLASSLQQTATLEAQNASLTTRLQQSERTLAARATIISNLETVLATSQQTTSALQTRNATLESDLATLKTVTKRASGTFVAHDLGALIDEQTTELQNAQSRAESLEQQARDLQKEVDAQRIEITALGGRLSTRRRENIAAWARSPAAAALVPDPADTAEDCIAKLEEDLKEIASAFHRGPETWTPEQKKMFAESRERVDRMTELKGRPQRFIDSQNRYNNHPKVVAEMKRRQEIRDRGEVPDWRPIDINMDEIH